GGDVDVVAVLESVTALGIEQRGAEGIADAAGDRSELVAVGGRNRAEREHHAVIVVGQPAVFGLDAEHDVVAEFVIRAALDAAEETAIAAAEAAVAGERATDV